MQRKLFSLITALCLPILIWAGGVTMEPLSGVFSVSSTQSIRFSPGNLQYQPSTATWQCAANQYDIIGDANANISSTYPGWIDLFGWGSGNNPASAATSDASYSSFTDWGTKVPASFGTGWRTLTVDEWAYLMESRTNAANRKARATVNAKRGMIILPDDWTQPFGVDTDCEATDFTTNDYTTTDWAYLEANGAVFLPAAGYRDGTAVYYEGNPHTFAYYWSSTSSDSEHAYAVQLHDRNDYLRASMYRHYGCAVRLVTASTWTCAATFTESPIAKSLTYDDGKQQALVDAGSTSEGTIQYKTKTTAWSTSIPTATDAGEYTVYYRIIGDDTHCDAAEASLSVTIGKATPVLTLPTAKTLTYDGTEQALVDAGSTNGGTLYYKEGLNDWSTSVPTATASGNYTVYYKVVEDANYYGVVEASLSVTIDKANPNVTAPTGKTLTFNEAEQELVEGGSTDGGTMEYKVGESDTWSSAIPTATNVGTYTVYYKVVEDQNYKGDAGGSVTATISLGSYHITANEDTEHKGTYYSTFYEGMRKYELPEGVEAYVTELGAETLNLTMIASTGEVIPAHTAVILKATSSSFDLSQSIADPVSFDATNNLEGVDVATAAPANCYVLSGHSTDNSVTGIGFYQYTGELKAHKAYVVIDGGIAYAPKKLRFVFNTPTGMETITNDQSPITNKVIRDHRLIILRNGVEYNVNGQMVK